MLYRLSLTGHQLIDTYLAGRGAISHLNSR